MFMLARDAGWPGVRERCTHADAAVVFHSLFVFFLKEDLAANPCGDSVTPVWL